MWGQSLVFPVCIQIQILTLKSACHYLSHLIWVDDQDCFAVDLLDLLWSNQVSHAHGFPARLSFPQHGMHGGQQGTNVTLLPLDPVQNLGHQQEMEREGGEPLASDDQIWNNY